MATKQIQLFAVRADLAAVLARIESRRPLRYVQAGLFDVPAAVERHSYREIPGFGVASHGDANHLPDFLVSEGEAPLAVRTVPQRSGGRKLAIDQQLDANTVTLRPGGVFEASAVIAGRIGTISDAKESLSLYRLFVREIRRDFERIQSFYVGRRALALLDAGYRLTSGVTSPPEYDLRAPERPGTPQRELLRELHEELGRGEVVVDPDDEEYVALVAQRYPFAGSHIDWERVPRAVVRTADTADVERYCAEAEGFFDEISRTESLPRERQVAVVNDGALDVALTMSLETLGRCLRRILGLPQHTYVTARDGSWCMTFTMEGDLGFGRAPETE